MIFKQSKLEKGYEKLILHEFSQLAGVAIMFLSKQSAHKLFLNLKAVEDVDYADKWFRASGLEKKLRGMVTPDEDGIYDLIELSFTKGVQDGLHEINKVFKMTKGYRKTLNHLVDYNFELIKNANTETIESIRKTITQAVAAGEGHTETVQRLSNLNLAPAGGVTPKQRANMISRTEVNRAFNTGNRNAYKSWGIEMVDLITARDNKVCDICYELAGDNPHPIGELHPPIHPNCYMPDTYIYTKAGWKLIGDITTNDEILSLNPETNLTGFLKPLRTIKHTNVFDFMYEIKDRWFNTCITPDHDCFIHQRHQVKGNHKYLPEFRKPDELNRESKFLLKAKNNNKSPEFAMIEDLKIPTDLFVKFMAWYLSEGNIHHTRESVNAVYINQEKEEHIKEVENIVKEMAAICKVNAYNTSGKWGFADKRICDYLRQFGKSNEKYIPSFIKELGKKELNLFLETYLKGDGHIRCHGKYNSVEKTLFTSSLKMRDDLMFIALLAGYSVSLHKSNPKGKEFHDKKRDKHYTTNFEVYRINLKNSKYKHFKKENLNKIEYKGIVYCVELPKYHTLWTMRNGKTCWNGNCRCTVAAYISDDLNDKLDKEASIEENLP